MATAVPSSSSVQTRPRLVFVNRSYWPDQEATGQLLTDLCTFLSANYDVHVICGQPNSTSASGEFLQSGCEVHAGVTIHRLKHSTFPKRWPAGRLLNLCSFTHAVQRYLRRSKLSADVFICETDPFLLPPVLTRHARSVRSKCIAYLQDIYPDVAVAIDKVQEGWLTRYIRNRLCKAYRAADRVVVLGEDMCQRLVTWGIAHERLRIVPNWVDCDQVYPLKTDNPFRLRHNLDDKFVVMHSGNMGLTQRLEYVIDATREDAWPDDAVLVLVGDGAMRRQLETQAMRVSNDRVLFFPYQAREELSSSLSAADLHLISMDHRITGCLFPSKFYGILASGTPSLMIAPLESEPAQIVIKEQVGWAVTPGCSVEIAKSVAAARNAVDFTDFGQRARSLALTQYDRKVACGQFAKIIAEVL